ncbi:MAG: hypothetical protein V3U69_04980, partial [Bacteroidota bacterium]
MSRIDEQILRVLRKVSWTLTILLIPSFSPSQEEHPIPRLKTEFILTARDTTIQLPHKFIVQGSDSLVLDSLWTLERNREYRIDYRHGLVHIDWAEIQKITPIRPATGHRLFVSYSALPIDFKDEYAHRTVVERMDTTGGLTIKVAKPTVPLNLDSVFGPNLTKSGSIVRGFSVASNQDLSLNSGFRMQLSGQIATDIEVSASLTDENTPIQPEGNTQTLREIDKVFIEVRGRDLSATVGDFRLDFLDTEFGRYGRKLQGGKGIANYRTPFAQGAITVSAAATEGKYTTNQFGGLEGVQGPYRLVGNNNERAIIVIAGTERVFVDGELMTRGETNDYTVEYGSGEITFMPRRLITSASRIEVDFEFTDRNYPRNLLASHLQSSLGSGKVYLSALFIREGDDQNSPINLSFSDDERLILAESGDDRLRAAKSGVTFVGKDSLTDVGRGRYAATDTLIDGSRFRLYRFVDPPDSTAVYSVIFSDIGRVPPDSLGYERVSVGRFRAVGVGKGNYLPIQVLPLAQFHQVADFSLSVEPIEGLKIDGELALSSLDENRLSSLDDEDNNGTARKLRLRWKSKDLRIGSTRLGTVEVALLERKVGSSFVPIDRINEIEFNRKWNIEQITRTEETIREGNVFFRPRKGILVGGGVGTMERGNSFQSTRIEARTKLSGPKRPSLDYLLEIIDSEDLNLGTEAKWNRHNGLINHTFGKLTPSFRFEAEDKETRSLQLNTLQDGSFRYFEYAPRLAVTDLLHMTFHTEFEWRIDDRAFNGELQREATTFTHTYAWRLAQWHAL